MRGLVFTFDLVLLLTYRRINHLYIKPFSHRLELRTSITIKIRTKPQRQAVLAVLLDPISKTFESYDENILLCMSKRYQIRFTDFRHIGL